MEFYITLACALLALNGHFADSATISRSRGEVDFELRMPAVRPTEDDQYWCTGKALPRGEHYIVGFTPIASARTVHHMLVFVCDRLPHRGGYQCMGTPSVCSDARIVYAWGRDAAGMHMPPGVGAAVGSRYRSQYIVVQLHYTDRELIGRDGDRSGVMLRVATIQPPYLSSILLFNTGAMLPANRENIDVDVACSCGYPKVHPDVGGCYEPRRAVYHPFAFRTHAHDRATQISAYIIRDDKWILIGTQSPQRPQAFYPVPDPSITILPDDILAARCTYNTTGIFRTVLFGSTRMDEMCNFYMMYYVAADARKEAEFKECSGTAPNWIRRQFPHPPLPFFNGTEGHHHHHHHAPESKSSTVPKLTMRQWPSASEPGVVADKKQQLGQVGGVAVDDKTGVVWVFHRGSRVWDRTSFSFTNVFHRAQGAIADDTVWALDAATGAVLQSWGKNMFYMPHGIFVDSAGYIWLTDVGLHQVFKFAPDQWTKPLLALGTRFKPGDDDDQFCKPADVVVDADGFIYVADGYCNHRIMKFHPSGKLALQWNYRGAANPPNQQMHVELKVPHALTLSADGSRLCVADREHGRILCYNPHTGQLMTINTPSAFNGRVFSIAFSSHPSGYMYAVRPADDEEAALGFTLRSHSKTVLDHWYPTPQTHFTRPHTMAVGKDGSVYVGEIGPNRLWKFSDESMMAPGLPSPTMRSAEQVASSRTLGNGGAIKAADVIAVVTAATAAADATVAVITTRAPPATAPLTTQQPPTTSREPATTTEAEVKPNPTTAAVTSAKVTLLPTSPSDAVPGELVQEVKTVRNQEIERVVSTAGHSWKAKPTASNSVPKERSSPPALVMQPSSNGVATSDLSPALATTTITTTATTATITGDVSAGATATEFNLFNSPDSVNVGVVFVLSFFCCILLLILVIASVRYCYRQQRMRSANSAPLRKLAKLAGRNGSGGRGEFEKLQQQETSDSDAF